MKLVICVQLAYVSVCLTREMSVVREWTSLDVIASEDGQESRRSVAPSDVRSWLMYKDRVFVTFYVEWEYYLVYVDLTDNSTSPLLRPYPSYENQEIIIFNIEVHVDRCDRLWVLSVTNVYKKHIIVIDIKTDSILKNITFPGIAYSYDMTFDDFDCDNEYVYISSYDCFWTYSWAEEDFWCHTSTHIASMILAPNSIVYYNVVNDDLHTVYYMPTTDLKDKSNKTSDITELGRSRILNVDLDSSAFDAKRDVLYYFNDDNITVIHAVPCWTSERCSSNCQGDIDVGFDPTHELKYITVDKNGDLWAVTQSRFEVEEINFRLLSVPAIKITCVESNANDTTNTSTDVEQNAKDTTNTSTGVESNTKDTTNTSTGVESNTKDTTNTSTGVESNTKDTTNTSTGVESNAKDTTNTSTGVESDAKDTTNTTNINESTTAASSTTEQTSTLGSVPKHTTVNITDTTAETPNSNISQAVGGTNVPYLLFSFTNTTLNLSNFSINNFTYYYNNFH